MHKSNVAVQYHNFNPSEHTKRFIDSIINEIQEELPSGSTVKATFTKTKSDDVVKGMLQVGSYNGPFFAVATASGLREVTMKLMQQMRRRLDKWKTKRHDHRTLRHLGVRAETESAAGA